MARTRAKVGYVDGFVLAVPRNKVAAYRKIAVKAGRIWMKHGALEYVECVGDDLRPNTGGGMKTWTFPKLAKPRRGETVCFSYIAYRSRAHRDAVNRKVMKDPAMTEPPESMPFDMKRMAYGGFKVLVAK
jgi:uncharacterized protein YbaA (DUF1428 family)